jgi:hypothetical protein
LTTSRGLIVRRTSTLASYREAIKSLESHHGLTLSLAWLEMVEERHRESVLYLAAETLTGDVVGLLPVYRVDTAERPSYDPVELYLRRWFDPGFDAARWYPSLLAGQRNGFAADVLAAPGEAAVAAAAISSDLPAVADETGARSVSLMYLTSDALHAWMRQPALPFVALAAFPIAFMTPVGESFDDFVADLPPSRRAIVRRELRRFDRSGGTLAESPLSEASDRISHLWAESTKRYGEPLTPAQAARALRHQAAHLDGQSRVFTVHRDGQATAFSLAYVHRNELYVILVGLSEAEPGSPDYFVVAYYAPLWHAYRHGLERINLGVHSYRPKALRGAKLEPRFTLLFGSELDDAARAALRTANEAIVADLATRGCALARGFSPAALLAPLDVLSAA